jgi:hypothetical protein
MDRPILPDPALEPQAMLDRLDVHVVGLVAQVQALYAGRWDDAAEDLRRRSAGRPYLFRLDLAGLSGNDEALSWLARCAAYEAARGEPLPAVTPTALLSA